MKILRLFLRYSPRLLFLTLFIGAFGGAASAGLMALINAKLNATGPPWASTLWMFAGLVLVVLLSNYASRTLMIHLAHRSAFDMRMSLCRQVVDAPLRRFEERGKSDVMAALTDDIPSIAEAMLSLPEVCISAAILVACLVYLGILSPGILLFLLLYLVFAVFSTRLPEMRAERILERARDDWDDLVGHFRGLSDGLKELKLHRERRESFLSGAVLESASGFRDRHFRGQHIYALSHSWGQVLYFVFIGAILYGFTRFGVIAFDVLTGYTLTVLYMRSPIILILDRMPVFARANVAIRKLASYGLSLQGLDEGEREILRGTQQALPPLPARPARIELRGLIHRYYREREEGEFELGPIDLTIEPGELLFIVGGNGSGKTTLAKLILGLYQPEGGQVMVDGEPVDDGNVEWYRQLFTAVFSDYHLFGTLHGLGSGGELDERARHYLRQLQLDHKVEVHDGVLSTTSLSQGQRKRLALLTAYLEDRPIYLFDEWAADQDPMFKRTFYLELLQELRARGKTVIVISHDDRYYEVADRVVKLDYGRLVAKMSGSVFSGDAVQRLISAGAGGWGDPEAQEVGAEAGTADAGGVSSEAGSGRESALAEGLQGILEGWPDHRVADLRKLAEGWEGDIYTFSLRNSHDRGGNGAGGEEVGEEMVAKIYLDHNSAERCRREARAMSGLHREGVAVPEVIACGDVGAGGPALVMRRVAGARSIGDVFADSPEDEQQRYVRDFCSLLVRIHRFEWRSLDGALLRFPADDPRGFLTQRIGHLDRLTERFGEEDFAEPLAWLDEHATEVGDQRLVLGHGDFHQSNVLVGGDGSLKVIDWGGAEVVDYRADLGWTLLLSGTRAPGLREAILEGYGQAMGEPVEGIEYFEALAAVRRLLNLSISLHHGAESLGMRPGAEILMRRDGDHFRQALAILQERTGLELPRLDALTARLA